MNSDLTQALGTVASRAFRLRYRKALTRFLVVAVVASTTLLGTAALGAAASTGHTSTAGTITGVVFVPQGVAANSIIQGTSGALTITGTGFAADAGNFTITSTARGLSFISATEAAGGTSVTGTFASSDVTPTGPYSITVSDDNGVETLANAFSVDAVSVPSAPTAVSATGGSNSIAVTWAAPVSDGGSAVTGYVTTATSGSATSSCGTLAAGATTCTITDLTAGTGYTVSVVALNALGQSSAAYSAAKVVPTGQPMTVFRITGVHYTTTPGIMTIFGTGFYGTPTITSNVKGLRAWVVKDSRKVLTVRVQFQSTSVNSSRSNIKNNIGVFTVHLTNGKKAKVAFMYHFAGANNPIGGVGVATATILPGPTPTTLPKPTSKPALPYVGTDYGYAMPPGNPSVVSDGFVNCDLPHPIAYIKFSTGYSELITVDMSGVDWTFPMDFEGAVLLNPLVVNDIPGEVSQGITHTAGADGCVIWPDASQPGYIGGAQGIDPNSPG
jgi:hypothetical protein